MTSDLVSGLKATGGLRDVVSVKLYQIKTSGAVFEVPYQELRSIPYPRVSSVRLSVCSAVTGQFFLN